MVATRGHGCRPADVDEATQALDIPRSRHWPCSSGWCFRRPDHCTYGTGKPQVAYTVFVADVGAG